MTPEEKTTFADTAKVVLQENGMLSGTELFKLLLSHYGLCYYQDIIELAEAGEIKRLKFKLPGLIETNSLFFPKGTEFLTEERKFQND